MKSSQHWMLNREHQKPTSRVTTHRRSSLVPGRASYRKKLKLWHLFTRNPAQLQWPRVLSTLTGPVWDACDGLEPEDVASDGGVNVILETPADAFQGEHETELFDALEDTFYGPGRKKGDKLQDYALRVRSNVRELAKQRVQFARPNARIPSTTPGVPEH